VWTVVSVVAVPFAYRPALGRSHKSDFNPDPDRARIEVVRHPQLGGTNEQIQNVGGANRGRGGSSHLGRHACFGRPTACSVARGRHRGWRRSRFGGGCGSIHVLLRVRLRQIRILWLRAFWSVWRRSLLLIESHKASLAPSGTLDLGKLTHRNPSPSHLDRTPS
jgi:hypothetical protein